MTTGTAIAIGLGVAGAGGLAFLVLRKKRSEGATGATGAGDPLSSFVVDTVATAVRDPFGSQIVTLPEVPPPPPPAPLPLGVSPDLPSGFGVIAAAAAPIFVPRGAPPPPPPPPIPVATSVGVLYFPPSISQAQAIDKTIDLAAIYASTARPEDDSSAYTPAATAGPAAVARRGKGHF